MTKQIMTRIAAAIVGTLAFALAGTACTSFEANKTGDGVQIQMPLRVEPDVQVENRLAYGSATVHSILFGLIRIGDGSQAVGVDCGSASTFFMTGRRNIWFDLFQFDTFSGQIAARQAAAYDAAKKAKADIILAPRYELETVNLLIYKRFDCKMKGYPGRIRGIRSIIRGK